MHEFSIVEGLLQVAMEHAGARSATRIHSITMRIGALSGVVPDALTFAFEALSKGTPAEGARLVVEEVPVTCYCPACEREFAAELGSYHCPGCDRISAEVRHGREMDLMSLEVS